MKYFISLVLLLELCCVSYSQNFHREKLNRIAHSIPDALAQTTGGIAAYLNTNLEKEDEKLYAAYRWVTSNLRYDTDSMYVFNTRPDSTLAITAAMRRRKGVCENFASIFADIVQKCGLTATTVKGYTKQGGLPDRAGHTWCAVETSDGWAFYDPTWDINFRDLPNYFSVSPEIFILSHFPFDPVWQLLDNPVNPSSFADGRINSDIKSGNAARENVAALKALTHEKLIGNAIARMEDAGDANELALVHLAWLRMQAAILREDRAKAQYDLAVENVNLATNALNKFIGIRNGGFPLKNEMQESTSVLNSANSYLLLATEQCRQLREDTSGSHYDTGEMELRILSLQSKIKQEEDFLREYRDASGRGKKVQR